MITFSNVARFIYQPFDMVPCEIPYRWNCYKVSEDPSRIDEIAKKCPASNCWIVMKLLKTSKIRLKIWKKNPGQNREPFWSSVFPQYMDHDKKKHKFLQVTFTGHSAIRVPTFTNSFDAIDFRLHSFGWYSSESLMQHRHALQLAAARCPSKEKAPLKMKRKDRTKPKLLIAE